jgi:replication initiation protein RepC
LRFSITIHLRDISKTILSALNENREGDWEALYDQLQALSGRVERNGTLTNLTIREQALSNLRRQVENLYLSNVSEPQMSGNERENEHHIQNSNIESFDKTKPVKTEKSEIQIADKQTTAKTQIKTPHLNEILNHCPQIENYAVRGIQNWKDLVTTAGHIRSMLGITLSAWQQACESMGEINAAVTVAALLERSDTIHSAGGYLRKLSQKAEIGQYSVQPVLRALSQTKH